MEEQCRRRPPSLQTTLTIEVDDPSFSSLSVKKKRKKNKEKWWEDVNPI